MKQAFTDYLTNVESIENVLSFEIREHDLGTLIDEIFLNIDDVVVFLRFSSPNSRIMTGMEFVLVSKEKKRERVDGQIHSSLPCRSSLNHIFYSPVTN
jgi:hypothetical protein